MKDPSWSEINHFVNFFNDQLELCEKSTFCQEAVVGDVLAGFKSFVVIFMIRMSKVCETVRMVSNHVHMAFPLFIRTLLHPPSKESV